MRTISPQTLAMLNQATGTEPIMAIEINWVDGTPNELYADRAFPDLGIQGRILQVQQFDDTLNISKSGTTQQVTITLDDSDGHLKSIFNNVDIHNRPVWIYQWFTGISYSDKFLLFLGMVSSPIVWKEGDRTLSFDVLSKIIDSEVGFSVEDGQFPFVPQELIGKAWPLIFGTAVMVPTVRVDALPHGEKVGVGVNSVLLNPIGIHDPALDLQTRNGEAIASFDAQLAILKFIEALGQASISDQIVVQNAQEVLEGVVPAGKFKQADIDPQSALEDRSDSFAKKSLELTKQGNELLAKAGAIRNQNGKLKQVLASQKAFEEKSIAMSNGELFPQNQTLDIVVGGATLTGYFSGGNFIVLSATHPDAELTAGNVLDPIDQRVGEPVITRNKYFFADAGTPTFHYDPVLNEEVGIIPIRYILCAVIPCNVLGLFAYRTITNYNPDGSIASAFKGLYPIPANYYNLSTVDFGAFSAEVVTFPGPLSSRAEGWEDEVFSILQSTISSNVADILIWIITHYTQLAYDPVSFAEVAALLINYPANFALLDRPNAIKLIQDIAYQSRCIVYLKNDTFYIKYLPNEADIVDTITESDILLNSLEVTTTETEDLVTKYTAEWSPDYLTKDPFKIILRYNIIKYGLHEQTYKYFIYNQQALVDKSAMFWIIRNANTWKLLKFKTTIKKLNIEALDTVTINFATPLVSNGPIAGIVQKAAFNSETFEIDFEVWLPIRLGEMTEYPFFYNDGISEQDVYPTQFDIDHGFVAVTGVTIGDTPSFPKFSGDHGNNGLVTYGPHKTASWGGGDIGDVHDVNIAPQITTRVDTTTITPLGKKPTGTTQYQLSHRPVDDGTPSTADSVPTTVSSTTNPGIITASNGDGTYKCDIYLSGLANPPTSITPVKCVVIDASDTIPNGVGVMITDISYTDPNDSTQTIVEHYMQPPVWSPIS